MLNKVKLLSISQLKIAKNHLSIESQPAVSTESQQYEWRRLVGSIRRRVQRHGTTSTETPEQVPSHQPVRRKSSLTHTKLDFLRREKSKDDDDSPGIKKDSKKDLTLAKQKSVGFDFGPESPQSTRPKLEVGSNKSTDVNKIDKDKLFVKNSDSFKGVRKSDSTKSKDNVKVQKSSNFSFRSNSSKSEKTGKSDCGKSKDEKSMNRDDFLKATMRIFLVVSPPVGKMQVNKHVFYLSLINFFYKNIFFLLITYFAQNFFVLVTAYRLL